MINIYEESTINFWIWRLRNQRETTKDKDHKSPVEKTLNNSVYRTYPQEK